MNNDDLLYSNNKGRKSFQWELWAMCNNICDFCYLGDTNRHTDKERQLISLDNCWNAIHEIDFNIYNNISFIGGEFFQGQLDDSEVHDKFFEIMNYVADLYIDKKIGSMWVAATLTTGDEHHLYEMLEMFDKKGVRPVEKYGSSGLWITTSWDSRGRFHTEASKKHWEYHMKHIHELYPYIKFNTTCILQEQFLQDYIDNKWSPKKFMEEFNTTLFYKQPSPGSIPDDVFKKLGKTLEESHLNAKTLFNEMMGYKFMPERETFLKFLRKYAIDDSDTFDRLFNIKYRADELHRNFNESNDDVKFVRCKTSKEEDGDRNFYNKCGHLYDYAPYIGNEKCVICDRNNIFNSLN